MRAVWYDPDTDVLTVDGIAFSGSFLDFLTDGEEHALVIWREGGDVVCRNLPGTYEFYNLPGGDH